MVGTLAFVLIGITGRLANFHLRGTDAYAGYCMAAAGFLALAHTLRRGEHIRVSLVLQRLSPPSRRGLDVACHAVGLLLSGLFAWFCVRLAWQSYSFNDVSQATDATPLWIPQLAMALGTLVLFIAFVDSLIDAARGRTPSPEAAAEPAHVE